MNDLALIEDKVVKLARKVDLLQVENRELRQLASSYQNGGRIVRKSSEVARILYDMYSRGLRPTRKNADRLGISSRDWHWGIAFMRFDNQWNDGKPFFYCAAPYMQIHAIRDSLFEFDDPVEVLKVFNTKYKRRVRYRYARKHNITRFIP